MNLTIGEKIKIVLKRQNITISDLASKLTPATTSQNLSNKFKRDNFSINEIKAIVEAIGCEFDGVFTLSDGTKI